MTERKPPEISFTTWVDQQIIDAEKRGVFDNLPGTGKPLPYQEETDYSQAWLRDYLRREGVPTEELAALKLRKETERLTAAVPGLPSEQHVRALVADLNRRIMEWRRNAVGPPIFVPRVDEEEMVRNWRASRPAEPPAASPARRGPRGSGPRTVPAPPVAPPSAPPPSLTAVHRGRRILAANRSRRLTTPQTVRPSTTGRWRNPLSSIIWAASSTAVSGLADCGSGVIQADTADADRSSPDAAARSTSRSVRMPARKGPCMTTAEPTFAATMPAAASATGVAGVVVAT